MNRESIYYRHDGKGEGRFFENAYGEGTNVGKANRGHPETATGPTGCVLQDL